MISKVVRQMIEEKFGQPVRYSKDCDLLAKHISDVCKTPVSGSTIRRLFSFVKGVQEPRAYTLDIIADYLGHKSWEQLLHSFEKDEPVPVREIEKLKPEQVGKGQIVILTYEPGKKIELQKKANVFLVISSNERKLSEGDEVRFLNVELHYPLTFTAILRKGEDLGRLQLAMVSGITSIRKD